jgi:hypothetical protein
LIVAKLQLQLLAGISADYPKIACNSPHPFAICFTMRPVLRKSSFLANLARARVLQTTSLSAMPPCTAEISRAQAMHSSARLDASAAFTAASERVSKLPAAPPNDVKLQLYALFKQATQGRNTTPKPGAFPLQFHSL